MRKYRIKHFETGTIIYPPTWPNSNVWIEVKGSGRYDVGEKILTILNKSIKPKKKRHASQKT